MSYVLSVTQCHVMSCHVEYQTNVFSSEEHTQLDFQPTLLDTDHEINQNSIKFPFKRKALPSHPSCNHLRQ